MSKSQKVTLCLVLLIVLLIAWGLFPLFFKWLMIGIGSKETALKDFGTFGDIYGSLNTLFTSATLIIVMYSAYLQRQANKDARDAMERQLQQAKEDTEEQLKQAREATEQQILNAQQLAHIQLEHARQYSMDQLALAKATHDAQMKESKYAIFSNGFNALLNYKHEKFLSVKFVKGANNYSAQEIFMHINLLFSKNIREIWTDISELDSNQVQIAFSDTIYEISDVKNVSEIFSYFYTVMDLFKYINRSQIDDIDKEYYKSVVINSLSVGEHVAIFWLGVFSDQIKKFVRRERIFQFGYDEGLLIFAMKFYEKEIFDEDFQKEWDNYLSKQTPT